MHYVFKKYIHKYIKKSITYILNNFSKVVNGWDWGDICLIAFFEIKS